MRITIDVHPLTLVFLSFHHALHSSRSCDDAKLAKKKGCWNCNIWPDWFTSHQLLLLHFFSRKVESTRTGKLRRLSCRFQTDTLESGNREPRQSRIWSLSDYYFSLSKRLYLGCFRADLYINFYRDIVKWWKFRRVAINLVDRTIQWCLKPQLGMNYMSAHHVVVLHKLIEHCA